MYALGWKVDLNTTGSEAAGVQMADDANSGDQKNVAPNPGQRVSPSSGRNVAAKQTTSRGKSSSGSFHQQQQQTVASSAKAAAAVPQSQTQGASRRSRPATTQQQQQTPPGVVAVPPGCRGPRSLYLKRQDNHGFGFTLRHFIVYPPESCEITDGGRHAAVGAVATPMDTIFVKRVHSEGAAARAGLRQGDRLVAVNGHSVAGLTYAQVVAFIKHGPPYLHLLVVSQEHDVLQKYFSETAHNPETNQRSSSITLATPETIDQFHTLNTQPIQQFPSQRRSIMLPQSSTPATANTPRPVTQPWSSLSPHISNEISAANWVATGAGTPLRAVESAESASYYRNREHIYQKPPNDSLSYSSDRQSLQDNQSNIYSEPYLLDAYQLSRAQPQAPNRTAEAQPQVPIGLRGLSSDRKARRGSEGSCPSSKETCDSSDYISLDSDGSEMVVSNKSASRHAGNNYLSHRQNLVVPMDIRSQTSYGSAESVRGAVQGLTYPNNAGCRLSLDAGRRESSVSLTSSAAEGSKDSLSSYDSTSTLTGHETDDSAIMSRLRKNFEQKEEFLRRPSQPTGWLTTPDDFKNIPATVIQREFYGRPQKLQKQVWPPNEPSPNSVRQDSPSRSLRPSSKPSHQNLQRIRTDLDSERDYLVSQGNKEKAMTEKERFYKCETDEDAYQSGIPIQKSSSGSSIKTSPRDKTGFVSTLSRIHENIPATVSQFSSSSSSQGSILNGSSSLPNSPGPDSQMPDEDGRYPPLVWRRARQFESGRPIPDDETGSLSDRTSLYSSELSRLSSKRVVPNVAVRKREFEVRSEELSRELRRERESLRRLAGRGSRSLESADVPVDTDNPPVRLRARSNSAESWAAAMLQQQQQDNASIGPGGWNGSRAQQPPDWRTSSPQHDDDDGDGERQRRRAVRQDSYLAAVRGTDRTSGRQIHRHAAVDEQDETVTMDYSPVKSTDLTTVPITNQNNTKTVNNTNIQPDTVPVIKIHPSTPTIPVTPVIKVPAVRPTQLDLSKPLNVGRLDNDVCTAVEDMSPVSSGDSNIPSVVMRRNKNTNSVGEEERAVRRVSYLKATWNDRMHVDSDLELSDTEPTPQILRSNSVSGGSSGSGSGTPVDRTGSNTTPSGKENHPIIKEGPLNCKITVQDFKRATDRSWKQVWAVLRGPTLSLYKDRHHHQSPMGASEADSSTLPGVVGSVDVRCSLVDVAGDYTKRKNVLRVSAAGQELLLQAEHVADMAHWVRSLQEQAGQPTPNEQEKECTSPHKQQACPQQVPAVTSIQVQGASRLSPLPGHKSIRKLTSFRNRSPTGQSPVNKTRKPSQTTDNLPSPKSKTWGRVVKQFRKIHHGAGSPSSPTAPEGATIGIPLEMCPMSTSSEFVPLLVETCTKIVEERGLDVIGIYRVPGNTAAITLLTEDVNKGFSTANLQDPRWNDVNVVSSLLKSFFRRLPDSLFTVELYPKFIEADKIEDNNQRLLVIRKLVRELPDNHYETLKYLCLHLKRVVEHSEVNKMEARNLAIVFGPTLVRAAADDMVTMVTDMSHQCRIVESLLCHVDWFFSEDEDDKFTLPPSSPLDGSNVEMESATSAANHNLLLSNINKIEGMKTKSSTGKEIAKVVKSSVISAANRKMQRKSRKQSASELCDQLKEDTFSVDTKDSMSLVEMKETIENGRSSITQQTQQSKNADDIPTMVTGVYNSRKNSQSSAVAANDATDGRGPPIVTYANLSQATQERVRRFEQETRAMMAKHKLEASSRNATKRDLDSSNENMIGSDGNSDNSADIIRKSLRNSGVSNSDVPKLNRPSTVSEDQFSSRYLFKDSTNGGLLSANNNRTLLKNLSASNMLTSASEKNRNSKLVQYDDLCNSDIPRDPRSRSSIAGVNRLTSSPQKMMLRRGSSVESMNAQSLGSEIQMGYNGTKVQNGTLKRLKTGREQITLISGDVASQHRFGSLDSLDKIHSGGDSNRTSIDLSDDGSDLLTSITTTLDHLFSSSASQSLTVNESIPFVDESPEKQISDSKKSQTTNLTVSQNISSQTISANKAPGSPIKLFRNPSLHKTNVSDIFLKMDTNVNKNSFKKTEKDIVEKEKDDDKDETSADNESLPDNDRVVKTEKNEKFNLPSTTKLKRSESLNKPDRSSVSPSNGKLKRSESLNRSSEKNEKLKRSDSLTKNEKTESNISKRRELTSSFNKKSTRDATIKLKRKNGMPERSIKRRHTVGGTKDFDKVHWLDNRLQNQAEGEESSCVADGENNKEKSSLRTSSPDLSSSRRERFLFEISLLGPEGMIVALRQHFIGARPQSLPESRVYKVPLESHV